MCNKEIERAVEDIMEQAELFAADAASIAVDSMKKVLEANMDQPKMDFHLAHLAKSYAAACFDSYATGAIEALKVANGEKARVPWMADVDTPTVARKLLHEEITIFHLSKL